ncbi:MAG: exodeoxyribonuclease VII large subunit [Gemmatimonadetes bacterium]|nr:exodeoxyribonuclease VII large subunit [Gemmatimonadota bacterium]
MRSASTTWPIARTVEPEKRKFFTVSAVVARADEVLRERAPHAIWVRGEVSNWKRSRAGHCFFCLKDEKAELSCVLWNDDANALPALPADGMEADVCGKIGLYVHRGQFRLEVERLETTGGDGLWHLARERLITQLRTEGLLDESRKRALPGFPERVGLVTSAQGAALQDMWRTMRRRAWWIQVAVSGCSVEGAESAPDIVRAIRRFGSGPGQTPVDVVILARGGGSRESLWAFNTEAVARAIAACPVPTISAVGHETDYTVADFVADYRAATPTAGAEHATPDGRELLNRLGGFPAALRVKLERAVSGASGDLTSRAEQLERRVVRRHRSLAERLAALEKTVHARAPRERHRRGQERLEVLTAALYRSVSAGQERATAGLLAREKEVHRAMELRVARLEQELRRRAAETESRSPLRVLARGYTVVTHEETGRVVREPDDAPTGTPLRLQFQHGALRAVSAGPEHGSGTEAADG